jgi:hypothetical protein
MSSWTCFESKQKGMTPGVSGAAIEDEDGRNEEEGLAWESSR